MAYASLKFSVLYTRADPFINETSILDYYDRDDKLNLDEINFKFAFAIEGYYDEQNKYDTRYMKQYLRMTEKDVNGSVNATSVPYHICNDEDYEMFYPPTKRAKEILMSIKESPDRRLYCVDDSIDKTIWGRQPTNFRTLEIIWMPCNVQNSWDADPDPISEECIADLKAQQNFMGPMQVYFYYNN